MIKTFTSQARFGFARRPRVSSGRAGLWALLLAIGASLAAHAAHAAVPVAVAANFTEPAREIAAAFKARTGREAVLSFGASGQFYTQIAHGAPYEVFLSADTDRPLQAERAGLVAPGGRFVYAVGKLVLYSATPGRVDSQGQLLERGGFARLAIADPATAPYGAAAVETLRTLKLYDRLRPQIVQGASITQAYQFVATGAAELGFVALSQVIAVPGGSRWIVPEADHAPIAQAAALLKVGAADPDARAFFDFLRSAEAKAIIRRFGYAVP